jgi:hypothetical protein
VTQVRGVDFAGKSWSESLAALSVPSLDKYSGGSTMTVFRSNDRHYFVWWSDAGRVCAMARAGSPRYEWDYFVYGDGAREIERAGGVDAKPEHK